jgi:hypothetical protein
LDCQVSAADDPSGAKVAALQERTSEFCRRELPLMLQQLFDRLDEGQEGRLVFDRLELNLGLIGRDGWVEECRKRLEEAPELSATGRRLSEDKWFRRALTDYLRTGFTPWNALSLSPADGRERLAALSAKADQAGLAALMTTSPLAWNRLKALAAGLGLDPFQFEDEPAVVGGQPEAEPLPASVGRSGSPAGTGQQKAFDGQEPSPDWPEPGVHIDNAGLALLAPFLPFFFRHLGLTDDQNGLNSPSACSRAVWLTQMIVDFPYPEGGLAFNKILCGWPPELPLEAAPDQTERETDEIDRLLTAVIGHWSALGKVSPSSLIDAFIRRPGLIRRSSGYYQLTVETRTNDVLLNALPWALSLIKTPWMAGPMKVDWNDCEHRSKTALG